MHTDFAFICDHADNGAKLHAHGIGIDALYLQSVPSQFPAFWFCAQISASAAETGQKQLEIRLMGPDGQDIVPAVRGQLDIPAPTVSGHPAKARLAMQFTNVNFPAYGEYGVHLVINGQEMVAVGVTATPPPTATSS